MHKRQENRQREEVTPCAAVMPENAKRRPNWPTSASNDTDGCFNSCLFTCLCPSRPKNKQALTLGVAYQVFACVWVQQVSGGGTVGLDDGRRH